MSDTDLILYHFPTSYYSLKVLDALLEKGVSFKEKIVFIHFGEQLEDWFLRLNPNGVVPVLQDGDKIIVESEEIINYIDRRCPSETPLVPDLGTKVGQEVDRTRKQLDDVNIEMISFGVMKNQTLCTTDLKFPSELKKMLTKENLEKSLAESAKGLRKKIDKASTEKDKMVLEKKLKNLEHRNAVTSDISQISKILDGLETTFDELEAQLKRVKEGCQTREYWLCGSSFTAADVTATTLILRLYMLGIDNRYLITKRPLVCEYKERLWRRPPVKKLIEASDSAPRLYKKKILQTVAKRVVKVGLLAGIVGAGVYIYRKYFR